MKLFSRIVLALGILGILLGIAVAGISALLPILNGPATSWDEAMLGIIPGVIVLVLSFFVFRYIGSRVYYENAED